MKQTHIDSLIAQSIEVKQALRAREFTRGISKMSTMIVSSLKKGKKLLIAGNGGSAADAQHFAAEIINKFIRSRRALPALSLSTDTSILTSITNDRGGEELFSRQIEALGIRGDILIVLSTSGNSQNILHAVAAAKKKRMICLGLLGNGGGKVASGCDIACVVPTASTPRIQECHILIIHILCQAIDQAFSR